LLVHTAAHQARQHRSLARLERPDDTRDDP
jgi:hypothetical protein